MIALLAAALLQQTASLDVAGAWQPGNPGGLVVIEVGEDGPVGTLFVIETEGRTQLDAQNPDEGLRGQPLHGTAMLYGFEAKGDRWRKGRIYDPEAGKVYRSAIRRTGPDTLEVKGCVGPICQTQEWTLAETPAD